METPIASLRQEIEQSGLDSEQAKRMLALVADMERKYEKLNFQNQRSENDKSISINILKRTVEELTLQKNLVEQKTIELNQNLEILQDSYQELEQFMQVASHDLKSPLNRIGNFGQLLSKRFGNVLNAEGQRYLEHVVEGARHMSSIINDLLEHNQLDRSENKESIDLQELIYFVLESKKEDFGLSDVSVLMPTTNIVIEGHRQNMVQIFSELIENAIKYRSEEAPSIAIAINKNLQKEEWCFAFSDNGVGLDEKYQEKVFLPFQRIDYLERPGSGIGLANCKKSVMKHGGKIGYTKNKDKGTTFFFTIPYNDRRVILKKEILDRRYEINI
jgi:light-regulated signal transduction histidine kinase (bacteriophytochrome)